MNETLEHKNLKNEWKNKLEQQGYLVELEKELHKTDSKESVVVDVYGEKEDEIFIVEVVNTSWSGKDPREYLDTSKKITFRIVGKKKKGSMDKKTTTQISLWVRRKKLKNIDRFFLENGYKSRSKFLLDCVDIIIANPSLLDSSNVNPLAEKKLIDLKESLLEIIKRIPYLDDVERILEIKQEVCNVER